MLLRICWLGPAAQIATLLKLLRSIITLFLCRFNHFRLAVQENWLALSPNLRCSTQSRHVRKLSSQFLQFLRPPANVIINSKDCIYSMQKLPVKRNRSSKPSIPAPKKPRKREQPQLQHPHARTTSSWKEECHLSVLFCYHRSNRCADPVQPPLVLPFLRCVQLFGAIMGP